MAGATFHGMRPWGCDAGIIECDGTELGSVDLHNECDFLELHVTPGSDADLLVRLMFRRQSTVRKFELSFASVSGFSVSQLDYYSLDALIFHDLNHVPIGSGSSTIEIFLASMRLEFRASKVEFLLL